MKNLLTAIASLAVLGASDAQASDWEFMISPYGWLPGLSGTISTPAGEIELGEGDGGGFLGLDYFLMGKLEAHNQDWSLILDVVKAGFSETEATPLGIVYSEASAEVDISSVTAYVGYRLFEDAKFSADVLGGFRNYGLDVGASLSGGLAPDVSYSASENWTDAVIGARMNYNFNEHWFVTGLADIGGLTGGDSNSWQAIGTVGYQFNEHWSLEGGYRHLDLSRDISGIETEFELGGAIVGFTYTF